jgi:NitT/TauT family transport system substrate-binding protein
VLVGREEVTKKKPAAIEKLLQALTQAADFMKQQPGEVQVNIARWLKGPVDRLQSGRFAKRYKLFLDQTLILAMEDEARWQIQDKLTGQTRMPNFLNYLDVEPLAHLAPQKMQFIIPRQELFIGPALSGTGQENR